MLLNDHWEHVHTLSYKLVRETRIQSFQTKIIHRIFPCKSNLHKWTVKNNDICEFCTNQTQENVEHYFYYCQSTIAFWEHFKTWWNNVSEVYMNLSLCEVLFGVLNYNDDNMLHILNYLILIAKWFIYGCKMKDDVLIFHNFIREVKKHLDTEKFIMYQDGKMDQFHQKWDLLYFVIS